ncbi:MAG: hypothetical protein M3512_04370 [Bacteroidota bacterium]|nr:hypothetical protein [Bacteroidota bacterium]
MFLPVAFVFFVLGIKLYLKINRELYTMREKIETIDGSEKEMTLEKISMEN